MYQEVKDSTTAKDREPCNMSGNQNLSFLVSHQARNISYALRKLRPSYAQENRN